MNPSNSVTDDEWVNKQKCEWVSKSNQRKLHYRGTQWYRSFYEECEAIFIIIYAEVCNPRVWNKLYNTAGMGAN